MLYLFWYNTFIVLYINALYSYLRQGAVTTVVGKNSRILQTLYRNAGN